MPTPDYTVLPSETDDGQDCLHGAIGCTPTQWQVENPNSRYPWGFQAPNTEHALYLPASKDRGRLLVFFGGGDGNSGSSFNYKLNSVAASQGYHVIGLAYYGAHENDVGINDCGTDPQPLSCYGDFMREVVYGTDNCEHAKCSGLNIDEHPQDSILNRLVSALRWAKAEYPNDGWERFLTKDDQVNWTLVNVAGFSNGGSYAALMGILKPSVGRVALFAGPNDGEGGSEEEWVSADYIQRIPGITDTHYYGLVHEKNKASATSNTLYKVTNAWNTFGMDEPFNPEPFSFNPQPGTTWDFLGAHMLISTDELTTREDAHTSVVSDSYENCDPNSDPNQCVIGYEPAWRCILGTGDASASSTPMADAGPSQTVECQGSGGANVMLNGSRSTDVDCDVLSYTWSGPFGTATGRNPQVFLPLGTSAVTLAVSDGWWSSAPSTTLITVRDTQPPSLQVTLTPTLLWPPNHKLVRINATITVADSCGGAPPQVVLTSITSNQPDNGGGDGDTAGDIQDAVFGTFDRSFLLRAERVGGDPRGRTYTVTYTAMDASGNCTQTSATVRVPHSR